MANEASINVRDAGDAETVAAVLARLVDRPAPSFTGDDWPVEIASNARAYVSDDDPQENDGYPVNVDVTSWEGRDATEQAARALYELLARRTGWALRLVTVGGATVTERPVLSGRAAS